MTGLLAAQASSAAELSGPAGWVVDVIAGLGAIGVGLLVALENLFPPIPSEVVLPVSGYLASQGELNLAAAIVAATLGALAGALVLYALGAKLGAARLRAVVHRLPLIEVRDVDRAQSWFDRHGPAAVLFGRCIPVVRSLVSVPAGASRMSLLPFIIYTLIGSAVWNATLILGGYALGSAWTNIGSYSDWINAAFWLVLALLVINFVIRRVSRRRRG